MRRIGVDKLARVLIGLAVVFIVQIHGPWGEAPGVAQAQSEAVKQASKIPSIVQQRIEQLQSAPAVGLGVTGRTDDLVQVTPAGELDLEFHAAGPVGAAEKADLVALGATILSSTADLVWPPGVQPPAGLGMIAARIHYDQVAAAAALPWVVAVRPVEVSPPDVGGFQSEGVALHGADVAQAAGISGVGVTVGVISDGATNRAAAQASGDLPAVITIPAGCVGTGGDEGTAMLEIIHDMAPGASLMFCATGAGVAGHVAALTNLAAAGANVIAEDIPFDSEPAFQKGLAATTADALAVSGVSMHSSAGNLGNTHAARVTAVGTGGGPDGAAGPFAGCPYNPQNVVAIAPGPDTTFDATVSPGTAGATLNVTLQWSEPRAIFPTAGAGGFTNLDLFVMDQGLTTCLGSSVGVQGNGAGDTIEQVSIPFPAGPNVPVKIVVNLLASTGAVAAPIIDLRWRGASATDAPTRAGSLNPDSNYTDGATSAAAANASASTDPTTVAIEPFSGGGPVQLITTTECPNSAYPCAGTAIAGGPGRTVGAPTWTAADGVSVSGAGNFGSGSCPAVTQGDCRFFGTSAAVPHAAAIAALVRQSMGTPTPAQLNARLAATATDRGTPGFDNVWGFGVLNAALAALGESADLSVTKICKPDGPITVGQTGTCTILVQNLGPDPARTVTIVDRLISNGTFTIGTVTASAGTCTTTPNPQNTSGTVTCTVPSIAANATVTITVAVSANTPQDINDDVTVSSQTPDPNLGNNSAMGAVHVIAASAEADLAITKTAAPPFIAGTNVTYTINVTNNGPSAAPNVVVTDTLPSQLSNVTFTPSQGSCTGGIPGNPAQPLTCTLGSLANAASASITVVGKIDASTPNGTYMNNNASVSSGVADPNNGNNSASAVIQVAAQANLRIVKTSDKATYKPSSRIAYTVTVTNDGPSDAQAVAVTDNLPLVQQAIYQSDTGGCTKSGNTLTCNMGTLAVGQSKSFNIYEVVKGARGTVSNTVTVSSSTFDPNTGNNTSTLIVTVKGGG